MGETIHILIIDSEPEDLLDTLRSEMDHFTFTLVQTLDEALSRLEKGNHPFELIITELQLSDSKDLDIVTKLLEFASQIPIITLSTYADPDLVRQIIRAGAQDYLSKDEIDPNHLHRVIYASIERARLRESLRALSFTDPMTAVYNRRGFFTLLEQQIELAKRTGRGFYLFLVDLDYLKVINDTYGHPAGDRALISVAQSLSRAFRQYDIVGRIGGDEFGVIVLNAPENSLQHLRQKLAYTFREQEEKVQEPFEIQISMGTAYFGGESRATIEALISEADQALYLNKRESHRRQSGHSER